MVRLLVPASLIAAMTLGVAPAHAQTGNDNDRARELAREGVEAFAAGDFGRALAAFNRAYALAPSDPIRFNVGMSHERLGQLRKAQEAYEAIKNSQSLSDAQRSEVGSRLQAVQTRIATLRIDAPPPPRGVTIDGVLRCTTPCELMLDPGRHELVYSVGTRDMRRSFVLDEGQEETLTLETSETPSDVDDGEPSPFGALSWIGSGVAVAGTAGVIGFGLRSNALHDDFKQVPTPSVADDGQRATALANASIGVALVGAALVLVDLLILQK